MRLSGLLYARMQSVPVVGWGAAMVVIFFSLIIWQNINNTNKINRQKITTAIETALADIQKRMLVVEMSARSVEHMLRSYHLNEGEEMRMVLESSLGAFEKILSLNRLDLLLVKDTDAENSVYGSLERTHEGEMLLWLHAGNSKGPKSITSFKLTENGFMPYSGNDDGERQFSALKQVAISAFEQARPPQKAQKWAEGAWELHILSQETSTIEEIVSENQVATVSPPAPSWHISYRKAFYDHEGRLLGLWDAHFDTPTIQAYVNNLQKHHGIELSMIERGDDALLIDAHLSAPQPVPEDLMPLFAQKTDAFADILQINNKRHWVAARALSLKGEASFVVVAARAVPFFTAIFGGEMWYVWVIAAGVTLVFIAMAHRAKQQQDRLGRQTTRNDLGAPHLALRDELTGLPNHVAIQQAIEKSIIKARETDALIALIYLDIDRFKVVNDSYGYLFGNAVLKATGQIICRLARPQDIVAYLNGDRFLILLDNLHHKLEVDHLVRQIMAGLKHPITVQKHVIHLSASIGVSVFPFHGMTADALISSADIAMNNAKQQGLDSYQFFTPAMGKTIHEHVKLEKHLRHTIKKGELHILYQPKVSLHDNSITGCEALLRWIHPEFGVIPPHRFIPIAESSGLILPIGDWVLTTVCREARGWLDAGLPLRRVAVNLSMRQFLKKDVVSWVEETLRHTQLPPQCLELELTESLLPQDMEKVIATLKELDALGVKLSLDDFGIGYSNLAYLRRMPIHMLKIDQGFIHGAHTNIQDAAIIRTVVNLAHSLNFKVLAEGVETREQLDFLREQSCDEIQGFYFSKPVRSEVYAAILRYGIGRNLLKNKLKQGRVK